MKSNYVTADNVAQILDNDIKVKVAAVDADGILRGKVMAKEKFLSSIKSGFGFSSAVFGWDMHDEVYPNPANMASDGGGYADFIAIPDLSTFRRLTWEDDMPFFLLRFYVGGEPVVACPRGLLASLNDELSKHDYNALAGVELEFYNFQTPSEDGYANPAARSNLAAFLQHNRPADLRPLTQGMFGYSITRPTASKKYFNEVFDQSAKFRCNIEGWHTESGPGVFEAALMVQDVSEMADRVSLFKLLTKSVGIDNDVTPCFMAKPMHGMPGSSGHIHISLTDKSGKNAFARETRDPDSPWPDIEHLSDTGRQFLAGVLDALPDIMPMLAPTVNSYKRFIENFWAPVALTWGLEDRMSSIRLIAPPVCKPSATRLEIRIPGADLHPHYALGALIAAGLRGIKEKLEIKVPPSSAMKGSGQQPLRLAETLDIALDKFQAPDSAARKLFDQRFVDFYAASRKHELKLWREAVTDWEFHRYIETI